MVKVPEEVQGRELRAEEGGVSRRILGQYFWGEFGKDFEEDLVGRS
jgi:hypothetical protein